MDKVPYPSFTISSGSQLGAELLFGGVALIALLYCISVARRQHSVWPLGVFGGSALLVTYEPFNNFLARCAYPGAGTHQMLGWLGQHVPWSTWMIYMFYFSFAVPDLMQRLERGMTLRAFWQYYGCVVAACAAFEPFFIKQLHWWRYYGPNQAFSFTGLPMFWWFANAMIVVGMAAVFHLLRRHVFVRDWQMLLFIPLAPLLLFGLHGSASAPVYLTMLSTSSQGVSDLATLLTIAISLLYVWILGTACTNRARPGTGQTSTGASAARIPVVV